jgi:hypothetical protein
MEKLGLIPYCKVNAERSVRCSLKCSGSALMRTLKQLTDALYTFPLLCGFTGRQRQGRITRAVKLRLSIACHHAVANSYRLCLDTA